MIENYKGSLFDAPKGSLLLHACNCKGRWGSGIAAEFAKRFPVARTQYEQICAEKGHSLLGTCFIIDGPSYDIACLFTSRNYGAFVDSPDKIIKATENGIKDLIKQIPIERAVNMPKINSGLFKVPWQRTQKVLKMFPDYTFNIWEP